MSVLDCLGTFVGHVLLLIGYTTWSIRHFLDFKFQTLTIQNHFKSDLFWARRPQCNFVTNGLTRTVYHNIKIRWLLQKNDQLYPNMKKHVKQPWSNSIMDNHSIYSNTFEYQFGAPATALFLQPRVSSIEWSSQTNEVPTNMLVRKLQLSINSTAENNPWLQLCYSDRNLWPSWPAQPTSCITERCIGPLRSCIIW